MIADRGTGPRGTESGLQESGPLPFHSPSEPESLLADTVQQRMGYRYAALVLLLFEASAEELPIYFRDFEDGVNPGMVDGTSIYAEITRYLESGASGHHVRFDFTVPEDSVEGASWGGGISTIIGNFSSLPPVWQLSFRVATSASVPEPLMVRFSLYTKPKLDRLQPLAEGVTLTFWVAPSGTGWQQVVVRSENVEMVQDKFVSPRISAEPDTALQVYMRSRAPSGEMLSLSKAGEHYLLLDDIDFRIPVAPFVSLQPRSDGKLSLFYTGRLQGGETLDKWTTLSSQPAPHSIIEPTGSKRFYRASDDY